MNANPLQNAYFERLAGFPIVVCRECHYGVWPSQIEGHLKRAHGHISPAVRTQLGDEIRNWPNIAIDPIELEIPSTRTQAIPQLIDPMPGWQCTLTPESCQYICRHKDTMRHHWQKKHQWSRTIQKGHPTRFQQPAIREHEEQACQPILCQQLFPKWLNSQYFAIIDEKEDSYLIPTTPRSTIWEQASQQYAEYEKQAAQRIQQGHVDEANPWLRRTGWVSYLDSFSSTQLLEYIDMPAMDDPIDQSLIAEPNERAIQAIWTAMGQVGQISQQSVIHTGVFVRMEAIRTERYQTRYQPLEAYQDPETIIERVRPWQQMLMFFWRTQDSASDKRHPPYRFTPRQQAAWNRLVQIARPVIRPQNPGQSIILQPGQRRPWELSPSPVPSASSSSEEESFTDDDEMDKDIHLDPELDPTPERFIPPLTPIQRACLDFCIELLN